MSKDYVMQLESTIQNLRRDNSLLKEQNARSEEILQKYYQDGITLDSVRALKQERDNYKKALEILNEHIKFEDRGIETYTDDSKNLVTKFLIRLESKDTGATIHIHLDTKEEFDILEEI